MQLPKRVMVTRTAMCGGGLAYDVIVPVKHVANYDGAKYTTICRSNGGDFVSFEDATQDEKHYAMPLGWERYDDTLKHTKAAKAVAFELAKVAFPELAQLKELPFLWTMSLMEHETHRDVMLEVQTGRIVGIWKYEDGRPVKIVG